MRCGLTAFALLLSFLMSPALGLPSKQDTPVAESRSDTVAVREQSPYQRRDTWYDFILKQFNRDNIDYGSLVEQHRREFIELCLRDPYFLYSFLTTIALLLATLACVKQRIDHHRTMWVTAEMMADLYNQDAYSRQVAQEAIERYNNHVENCNRAIEVGENQAGIAAPGEEMERLRTELMRIAEERDTAIRDRNIAREDLRRKSEILADMSLRLDAATNKNMAQGSTKAASGERSSDGRLVRHINSLQEQLYAERNNNRRLKGG